MVYFENGNMCVLQQIDRKWKIIMNDSTVSQID